MAERKACAGIGSVSSGTMRERDLIPAFMDILEFLDSERAEGIWEENPILFEHLNNDQEGLGYIPDELQQNAGYLTENLFDALQEYAPPYACFGSTEGDGADYGFWICHGSIEEDIKSGEILKIGDTGDIPSDYEGLAVDIDIPALYECKPGEKPVELWNA